MSIFIPAFSYSREPLMPASSLSPKRLDTRSHSVLPTFVRQRKKGGVLHLSFNWYKKELENTLCLRPVFLPESLETGRDKPLSRAHQDPYAIGTSAGFPLSTPFCNKDTILSTEFQEGWSLVIEPSGATDPLAGINLAQGSEVVPGSCHRKGSPYPNRALLQLQLPPYHSESPGRGSKANSLPGTG